ncbi:MAG: DUF4810 domain-containing protein [Bacteroidales bacterium]|nr:DUF4810 domain-containing protein [Bacteroidales bacterium]
MKEQNEANQAIEINDFISKAEAFLEKYKNHIYIGVAAVIIIIAGIFGLKKLYFEPRAEEAAGEMFMAENFFDNYDYDKALNGDKESNSLGFLDIISDYKGTEAANLAYYYAGVCELRLGQYEEAIEHLKKFSSTDNYVKPLALMAQGDAEAELQNNDKALALYEKAAAKGDNILVAPTALFKAGMMYLAMQKNDKAIACFNKVKEKYPESTEYSDMDKYIAVAEASK